MFALLHLAGLILNKHAKVQDELFAPSRLANSFVMRPKLHARETRSTQFANLRLEVWPIQVLPTWSQKTLTAHRGDKRDIKTIQQLEEGNTGDEIWDALQYQLNHTGTARLLSTCCISK